MMAEAAGHGPDTCYVGWLPLFHDMGLAGVVLQSLYLDARCVLMPPRYFVQDPMRWLRAISTYRATTTAAPDFAYDMCARSARPEDVASLDLSSWTVAVMGGEPVRARTLERFGEAYAPAGFRREAFFPCYGLAEATVFVTGPEKDTPPVIRRVPAGGAGDEVAARDLVGCGFPRLGEEVVIVDPDTRQRRAAGSVGEIWVHGPSVAAGYWGRESETRETFHATLADDPSGRAFLRTGDLGMIHDAQLFVTGRLKDLIIVRGQNHHPQDIEHTVRGANLALTGCIGAAFSVDVDGEERLALVQEVARAGRVGLDVSAVLSDARQAVVAEHAVRPHAIVLVRPGWTPMTTSGKVRRRLCRKMLLDDRLPVVGADFGDPPIAGRPRVE